MTRDELVEKVAQEIATHTDMGGDGADIIYCRDAARAAIRIVLSEVAKVLNDEKDAMLEQRDEILDAGTLGGRPCPERFKQVYAHERKTLAEGYEGMALYILGLEQ